MGGLGCGVSVVAALFAILGLLPLLGWLNWFTTLPAPPWPSCWGSWGCCRTSSPLSPSWRSWPGSPSSPGRSSACRSAAASSKGTERSARIPTPDCSRGSREAGARRYAVQSAASLGISSGRRGTTQNSLPCGSSMIHQCSTKRCRRAPSASSRATSASRSSVSKSR